LPIANNSPLRSGKGSCYEGGIRVPLIVSGPEVTKGATNGSSVISSDLFFTLLDAAGISNGSNHGDDGVSLSPILANPTATLERDTLPFHYPHYYRTTTPVTAIRKGDWKLLEYYEDGRVELYNLQRDLGETEDLSESRPEIARMLQKELRAWKAEVNASEPELNSQR
jgi:arylsulfatase A